jgi:hypothetical protein
MKSLLIYNDNLPFDFVNSFEDREKVFPARQLMMSEDFDMDNFIHDRLMMILGENTYDCIFLPYNLNNENYLEFTGLIVALHIRLTPSMNHQLCPIVFVGPEKPEQVAKYSEFGSILFTKGIFKTDRVTSDTREKIEEFLSKGPFVITKDDHNVFLSRIIIRAPANYSSHHSIANEWGIHRLFGMFKHEDSVEYHKLKENVEKLNVIKTLYFKYLEANGERQNINRKVQFSPIINGIQGKTIYYIDDEGNKGWNDLLCYIFKKSEAKFLFFNKFSKDIEKVTLLQIIKEAIDKNDFCDLYIVDLRLHDDDFDLEADPDSYTGLEVLKYLKRKNQGLQALIFTASNKSWNYKKAIGERASGYIIKESPEQYLNREGSRLLFVDFSREVKSAIEKSFLKIINNEIKEIKDNFSFIPKDSEDKEFKNNFIGVNGWLDQLIILLNLDAPQTLNQSLIICFQILENYCNLTQVGQFSNQEKHSIARVFTKANSLCEVFTSQDETLNTCIEPIFGKFSFQKEVSENTIVNVIYHDVPKVFINNSLNIRITTAIKYICIFKYRDNIDNEIIMKIVELWYLRSNLAAHDTGNINKKARIVRVDDILFLINVIYNLFSLKAS